jgi:membrane protein
MATWRERLVGWVRALLADWADEKPGEPLVFRCARGLLAVEARDRTFILAGQAFIALIPLMIVAATLTTASGGSTVAKYLVERYELSGELADSVLLLFGSAPGVDSGLGILSILILLFSLNSFGRSTRRTLERAWRLPRITGTKGLALGLAGLATWILTLTAMGWIASYLDEGPVQRWLALVGYLLVALPGWLASMHLFLARRVSLRSLVPGTVFASLASLAVAWSGMVWFPILLARDAAKYGLIGVSFALVSLLIVLAAVFVATAVISAETAVLMDRVPRRGSARPGTQ